MGAGFLYGNKYILGSLVGNCTLGSLHSLLPEKCSLFALLSLRATLSYNLTNSQLFTLCY